MELKQKIADIQKEIGKLEKDKDNPFFKSKYVDLNQILDTLKPLEEKHKICITQPLSNIAGRPAIDLCIEDLESDEFVEEKITLPDLQDPQKMGSCITYYRRYQLLSYFKMQTEDDDANLASKPIDFKKIEKNITKKTNPAKEVPNDDLDL